MWGIVCALFGCGGKEKVAAGGPCAITADCQSGLLCIDGVCGGAADADSDADTDADSDSDTSPSTDTDPGIGCEDFQIEVREGPPSDLVLLVDRSGSMTLSMPEGGAKWDAMVAAVDSVTHTLESRIHFGLARFPAPGPDLCASGVVEIEPAADQADEIVAALAADAPSGGTPTAPSVQSVGDWLAAPRAGHETHPPAILLATDGGPGCNAGLDPAACTCMGARDEVTGDCLAAENCLDDVRTYDALESSFGGDPSVPTWIVGLPGTESYTDVLGQMATRGGTARDVEPFYWDARSADDLALALEEIASSLVTCVFTLDVPPTDPEGFVVYVDGEEVPESIGGSDGWAWTSGDHTSFELIGRYCDMLSDRESHQLTAYFDCENVY